MVKAGIIQQYQADSIATKWMSHRNLQSDVLAILVSTFCYEIKIIEDIPPGPHIFVCNHQVVSDIFLFHAVIIGLRMAPTCLVAAENVDSFGPGEMLMRLSCHPEGNEIGRLYRLCLIDKNPAHIFDKLMGLESEMRKEAVSVVVAAEGRLQFAESDPVKKMSSILLDMALRAEARIYPVYFMWGLPRQSLDFKFVLPYRLRRQRLVIGRAITPNMLRSVLPGTRTKTVLRELNALHDAPPVDHCTSNKALFERVLQSQTALGMAQIKAIICDQIVLSNPAGLSQEGRRLRAYLMAGVDSAASIQGSAWLSAFALWISEFGLFRYMPHTSIYKDVIGSAT